MAVIIINPNSTAKMTDGMVRTARSAAPGLGFEGWTSTDGPPAIQGRDDGRAATPPLLELVAKAQEAGAEGIIIGCFDDTALAEARALATCPVIGIGEASYRAASLKHKRFSVVTTLEVSVPIIEENISTSDYHPYLARVRASGLPVLALEEDPGASARVLQREASSAAREDGIEAVVLGCAGMVGLSATLRESLDIDVVDPLEEAARWIQDLVKARKRAD